MFRYVVPGAVCLFIGGTLAFAQQSPNPPSPVRTAPPPAAVAPSIPPDSEESMEETMQGDHWTYETRDEITGHVKGTVTQLVTEVSATAISLRTNVVGNGNSAYGTYDRAWNLTGAGLWRYSPNDGTGVRLPLTVGKTWTFQGNDVNSSQGVSNRRSGTSKVTGRETITTRAGTFDAFKIETSYTARNANDPTKKWDYTLQTWYVPSVNHWVKRVFTFRSEGQLRENTSTELVEYGRK
jgi:hypothetical protein